MKELAMKELAMKALPMKIRLLSTLLICAFSHAQAQQPSSAFARGNSMQTWQHPDYQALVAQCKVVPPATRIGGAAQATDNTEPPAPALPAISAIPDIVAADAAWKVVWAWQGNNADGPIDGGNGTLLFANNDASNVMQLDPATGLARILFDNTNTGGAVSRSKNGNLFVAERGLHAGIEQLEPERKMFANTINGEPLDCAGGVVNDISADAKGGIYIATSNSGVFYADPKGVITKYGAVPNANGIILNADETVLYVTNGPMLVAFDVQADGSLTNQRDFAPLNGGGDGAAIDEEGRIYVANGSGVNVIAPDGKALGNIPGPRGLHGVAFGGADKKTLFGIVFYGGWGTPSARNQVIALPTLAQGYMGRAK
ncbi:MAG: SMP-30/gluconolactonase/LRE family protein [Pseudomonadota bacterium]